MKDRFCPFNSPQHTCQENCVFFDEKFSWCNLANLAKIDLTDFDFYLYNIKQRLDDLYSNLFIPPKP